MLLKETSRDDSYSCVLTAGGGTNDITMTTEFKIPPPPSHLFFLLYPNLHFWAFNGWLSTRGQMMNGKSRISGSDCAGVFSCVPQLQVNSINICDLHTPCNVHGFDVCIVFN